MLVLLGQDVLSHPSRELRAAPVPPYALHQSFLILCPSQRLLRAWACSTGKEKKQQAVGCGVLFHFIQVPLKRSLYKSAHENAEETPGLHGHCTYLQGPPKKKGGTEIPGTPTTSPDTPPPELQKTESNPL